MTWHSKVFGGWYCMAVGGIAAAMVVGGGGGGVYLGQGKDEMHLLLFVELT